MAGAQEENVELIFGVKAADDARTCLKKVTEVFRNAPKLLGEWPEAELGQGLWDLSDFAFRGLFDSGIDESVRKELIDSFVPLFREFFAVRCLPVPSHGSREGTPLNIACYMWFDFNCWSPHELVDEPFLAAMEAILRIDHVACQESALHGLGHWHRARPEAVERIIDEFLNRHDNLRDYALAARCGCVL